MCETGAHGTASLFKCVRLSFICHNSETIHTARDVDGAWQPPSQNHQTTEPIDYVYQTSWQTSKTHVTNHRKPRVFREIYPPSQFAISLTRKWIVTWHDCFVFPNYTNNGKIGTGWQLSALMARTKDQAFSDTCLHINIYLDLVHSSVWNS